MDNIDLIIFSGLPGTGKSFNAEKLSKYINVPILDPDLIRDELKIFEYNPKDTPGIMQELFKRKIDSLIKGDVVIMSSPYVSSNSRKQSYDIMRNFPKSLPSLPKHSPSSNRLNFLDQIQQTFLSF